MTLAELADELAIPPTTLVRKARKAGLPIRSNHDAQLTPEYQSFLRHIAKIPKDQLKGFGQGVQAPFKPKLTETLDLPQSSRPVRTNKSEAVDAREKPTRQSGDGHEQPLSDLTELPHHLSREIHEEL